MNIFEIPFPELHMGYLFAYMLAGAALALLDRTPKTKTRMASNFLIGLLLLSVFRDLITDWRYPIFSFAEAYFGYHIVQRFKMMRKASHQE